MDIDIAMAANRVILTTERIVSNEQIRRTPDQTRIPFFTVEAVVEAPMRLRAARVLRRLRAVLLAPRRLRATSPPRTRSRAAKEYLDRYFYGPKSWPDYLAKLGMDAVLDACRRGRSVHND